MEKVLSVENRLESKLSIEHIMVDVQIQTFTLKSQIQKFYFSHCFHQTRKCKQHLIPSFAPDSPLYFHSKFKAYLTNINIL